MHSEKKTWFTIAVLYRKNRVTEKMRREAEARGIITKAGDL